MKKVIKIIVFAVIIVSLVSATGVVIKTGKFAKLEGYMCSFAAEIVNSATDSNVASSNATSSNATSSNATSSNATSSNATSSNATSSNATSSNATSSNATSSNATNSNATSSNATSSSATSSNVQTNTKPSTPNNTETEESQTNSENLFDNDLIEAGENTEVENKVSFLESHKMYIMIIGASVLTIVIVSMILIIDKKRNS